MSRMMPLTLTRQFDHSNIDSITPNPERTYTSKPSFRLANIHRTVRTVDLNSTFTQSNRASPHTSSGKRNHSNLNETFTSTLRSKNFRIHRKENNDSQQRTLYLMGQCDEFLDQLKTQDREIQSLNSIIQDDATSIIKNIDRATKGLKKNTQTTTPENQEKIPKQWRSPILYELDNIKNTSLTKQSQTEWLQQSEKLHNYLEEQIIQSAHRIYNGVNNKSAEKYETKVCISGYLKNPFMYHTMLAQVKRKKMAQITLHSRQFNHKQNKNLQNLVNFQEYSGYG